MDYLWLILVFAGTFFISLFGFFAIIGSIRVAVKQKQMIAYIIRHGGYPVSPCSTALSILIWSVILGFGCFAVHFWLYDYRYSYYIATVIAFLLSLRAGSSMKDIAEATHMQLTNSELKSDISASNISEAPDELQGKQKQLRQMEQSIEIMKGTLENAKHDLGDNTVEDVLAMNKSGAMTNEQAQETIRAIENLQFIIDTYPALIEQMESNKIKFIQDNERTQV